MSREILAELPHMPSGPGLVPYHDILRSVLSGDIEPTRAAATSSTTTGGTYGERENSFRGKDHRNHGSFGSSMRDEHSRGSAHHNMSGPGSTHSDSYRSTHSDSYQQHLRVPRDMLLKTDNDYFHEDHSHHGEPGSQSGRQFGRDREVARSNRSHNGLNNGLNATYSGKAATTSRPLSAQRGNEREREAARRDGRDRDRGYSSASHSRGASSGSGTGTGSKVSSRYPLGRGREATGNEPVHRIGAASTGRGQSGRPVSDDGFRRGAGRDNYETQELTRSRPGSAGKSVGGNRVSGNRETHRGGGSSAYFDPEFDSERGDEYHEYDDDFGVNGHGHGRARESVSHPDRANDRREAGIPKAVRDVITVVRRHLQAQHSHTGMDDAWAHLHKVR